MLSLDDIALLFARHGASQYSGEPVTQLAHALQTAHLAEQSGADDALVTACLLHDLGHLLNEQGDTPSLRGIDDTHQYYALPFLRGLDRRYRVARTLEAGPTLVAARNDVGVLGTGPAPGSGSALGPATDSLRGGQ